MDISRVSSILPAFMVLSAILVGGAEPAGATEYDSPQATRVEAVGPSEQTSGRSVREPARSVPLVDSVEGQVLGEIVFSRWLSAYAVVLDDRIELIDRTGTRFDTLDLVGVTALAVASGGLIAGTSDGHLHWITEEQGVIEVESWNVADGPIRDVAHRVNDFLFVTEEEPSNIGSFSSYTDEIDPDFIVVDADVEMIEVGLGGAILVSTENHLRRFWVRTFEPYVVELSAVEVDGITDFVIDSRGSFAWATSSQPLITEVDTHAGEVTGTVLRPAAIMSTATGNYSNDRIGFVRDNDDMFQIQFHEVHHLDGATPDAIALIALDPGQRAVPQGLALGRNTFAAVIEDDACSCLRVVVETMSPSLDDPLDRPQIEQSANASITLDGQSFATIDSVTEQFTERELPHSISTNGRSITVELSSFELGHKSVRIASPAGTTTIYFELIEPIPVPEPVDFTVTACPWLTDSIQRLYSAYFLRFPDQGGFSFWLDGYSTGAWSLPRMSAFFSQSPEFQEMYGSVSDAEFIDLIYRNIFGRSADAGGRDYWLGRMSDEQLDRGTVMLFFSESPEYITQTETQTPFAGHFNWYPEGTTWACGLGAISVELPAASTWVDVGFWNLAAAPTVVTIDEYTGGQWEQAYRSDVPGESLLWIFAVERPSNVTDISLESSRETAWTLVMSPTETPLTRAGWPS